MYPQLPVELLVIIAEFLISGFAFGTTAAFNQALHLVRNETLPVLYETVCHEFLDSQDPRPDVENSPGFQYTKYVKPDLVGHRKYLFIFSYRQVHLSLSAKRQTFRHPIA
jgi:hypothetical protein